MFRLLRTVTLATIGMWVICAVALLIYTNGARAPQTHTLVIPDGTSQLIAAGQNPLEIPATWSFLADDTLKLVNRDRVDHWFGGFFVPALTTREYGLQQTFGGSLFCSVHPAGAVTIDVHRFVWWWRSVKVDEARVTRANIRAGEGFIHQIDSVLDPGFDAPKSILEIAAADPDNFSILSELVDLAGLSLALDNDLIDVQGKVVYLEEIDDERCAMGIQFIDVGAAALRVLERYVARAVPR